MITQIRNARIITMEQPLEVLHGDIFIKDSRIIYLGDSSNYRDTDGQVTDVIEANGNLIMPGFKNAHSHCPMTFARSLADGMPLDEWLNTVIFPMESRLTAEQIYWFTQLAYLEYLSGGITSTFNMYYEPEAMIKAALKFGFRTVLCGAINNFKESVDLLESYYNKYNSLNDLITYQLGFHAEYTTDLPMIKDIGKLAQKYKAPVHVHNSETKKEVSQCIGRYGITPTALFESNGIYDYGGSGFHSVYLTEEDMDIFTKRNVFAVINACSNAKLASGIAPVQDYICRGMNLALGTDGASSNNALDIFREMYFISMMQKIYTDNPQSGSPAQILEMATVGGAHAMGLNDCDTLSLGKKADIIMIDMKNPSMQPENSIINNLVYSGSKSTILMTMINGKILYKNGEFTTVDSEEIMCKVSEMMQQLR